MRKRGTDNYDATTTPPIRRRVDGVAVDAAEMTKRHNTSSPHRCSACHTVDAGGNSKQGPNLHGVFSAKAGKHAGYEYSGAFKSLVTRTVSGTGHIY